MSVILSSGLFVLVMLIAAAVFIQGDIAVSLSQFAEWVWPKIRWVRHIRKLINVPFHVYLHKRTRNMPFCLGQVWVGVGTSIRVIGKAQNGDWVLQLSKDIQGIMSPLHFREKIYDEALYLYEWDQSIDYLPTIDSIHGLPVIILKRHYPF